MAGRVSGAGRCLFPGREMVLTGDEAYEVELHDAQNDQIVHKWRYDAPASALAFSADGRRALMGFADGAAILCDVRLSGNRGRYTRAYLSGDSGCW